MCQGVSHGYSVIQGLFKGHNAHCAVGDAEKCDPVR
jgi:hypothetical protein